MDKSYGTISSLRNGFGFIYYERDKDIFFHVNSLVDIAFDDLVEGAEVTFTMGKGPKGPIADNIILGVETGSDGSLIELIIKTSMQAIAAEIAKNPNILCDIEWRDLERTLFEVFDGLGFETELTRSGKDGGYDIKIVIRNGNNLETFLIEVKHWIKSGKKPGGPILTSFVDVVAKRADNKTSGILLSSSGFTRRVLRGRSKIDQQIVKLGGSEKIVSLCRSYIECKEGLWSPVTPLSGVLLSGTF